MPNFSFQPGNIRNPALHLVAAEILSVRFPESLVKLRLRAAVHFHKVFHRLRAPPRQLRAPDMDDFVAAMADGDHRFQFLQSFPVVVTPSLMGFEAGSARAADHTSAARPGISVLSHRIPLLFGKHAAPNWRTSTLRAPFQNRACISYSSSRVITPCFSFPL